MSAAGLATSGPAVFYGQRLTPGAAGPEQKGPGPSVAWGGVGLIDPRAGYNVTRAGWLGLGSPFRHVMHFVPATKAANNIAAAATVTSGTAMTLVSSSGAGINVLAAAQTIWAAGTVVPAGTLVIDATQTLVGYGQPYPANLSTYENSWYSASTQTARAVSVTAATSSTGGAFTVAGWDMYGYPQTETITSVGNSTVNGKKGWKYIASVKPSFTDTTSGHTYSVGTTDILEFPLRADFFDQVLIWNASTLITASTGFLAADTTSPATSATGSVRGTYALQTASNGTNVVSFAQTIPGGNLGSVVGMFGVTPA